MIPYTLISFLNSIFVLNILLGGDIGVVEVVRFLEKNSKAGFRIDDSTSRYGGLSLFDLI